jgi:putative tryptophan/tyrosine transport system substrate-binding protein
MPGSCIAYGRDGIDQFRGAAGYVARILKGEKPGNLPVQAPTKYELVINLKTDPNWRWLRSLRKLRS